ncbi:Spc24-domain-containing protein [Testicularia cyperi]|uniref:Kinetochore protein Spc24 n=1 Tax=Testicularia cyperi TaxID=1882483 RepID=A0A317XWZ1_9BASI|nr:Spc24-domain-containing protein [Testicularia cyperi]
MSTQPDNSAFLMPPPSVARASSASPSSVKSASPVSTGPNTPAEPAHPSSMPSLVKDEARLTDADIDNLIQSLSPHEELDKLRQIEKTIRETQTRRRREEEEMKAKIHGLESSLSDLKRQSTRQAADWRTLNSHAEQIEKLDNRNFDLAKKINEQESLLSALQTQVADLKSALEDLELDDVEDQGGMDKDALRLKIFRSLGFLPSKSESDPAESWSSILVRSDTRNTAIQFDIHTQHLKDLEISPLILADQLWRAAE